ncbi:uncharacterized protein LOC114541491 [Dendronephthya gigantea]|uniref:uncharacterized protein LOC114541491 n=1 Tax=Dendronephthya gigantea TaxID=151771 RepID=UPI00106C99BD|nr:uncharacterized protein LOC114541491 [Dendronephthya gigantea]
MEGDREKTPTPSSDEQQGEIINSLSTCTSDEATFDGSSSSTDSLSSNSIPDNLDHHAEMDKNDVICPKCNSKLNPKEHKFCFGCGKPIEEIISTLGSKQVLDVFCPNCDTKLKPKEHKFCFGCGKSIEEIISTLDSKEDAISSDDHVAVCGDSELTLTRVAVVLSDVIEVKQPIVLAEIVVEQGSQQFTSCKNNGAQSGTIPIASGVEQDLSDTHNVRSTSEESVDHAIVVASENQEVKQFVETLHAETLVEDVQKSLVADTVSGRNATGTTNPERTALPGMPTKSVQLSPSQNNFTAHQIFNVAESKSTERNDKTVSKFAVAQEIQTDSMALSSESPAIMAVGNEASNANVDVRDKTDPKQFIAPVRQKEGEQQLSTFPENLSVHDHDIDVEGNEGDKTHSEKTFEPGIQTKSIQRSSASSGETNPQQIVGQGIQRDRKQQSPASSRISTIDNKCIHVEVEVSGDTDPKRAVLPEIVTGNSIKSSATEENLTEIKYVEQRTQEHDKQSKEKNVGKEMDEGSEKTGDKKPRVKTSENEKSSKEKGNEDNQISQRHKNEKGDESENADDSDKTGDKKPEGKTSGSGKSLKEKGNEDKFQGSQISQKNKNEKGNGTSTGAQDILLNPGQDERVQEEDPKKKKTLLNMSQKEFQDPLSRAKESAKPAVEGNGYFYQKQPLPQNQTTGKKNKKNAKNSTQTTVPMVTKEKTLTVVFHAALSDKFDCDGDTKIVIRGEEPGFGGWNELGVPISTVGYINKQLLLQGELKFPLRLADRAFGYKYLLLDKKGEGTYEELVEFTWFGITNRCLVIGKKYAAENSSVKE